MGEEEEEEEGSVEEFCTPIVTPPPRANSLFASAEIRKKKNSAEAALEIILFPADGKLAWHVKSRTLSTRFYVQMVEGNV